jgi:peroxiredoxin
VAGIADLKSLLKKYADKGLVIIGASLDAEPKAKKATLRLAIPYPVLADATQAHKAFEANLLPTLFLIGKDGKVLWKGYEKDDAMQKVLEEALK